MEKIRVGTQLLGEAIELNPGIWMCYYEVPNAPTKRAFMVEGSRKTVERSLLRRKKETATVASRP